jgi:hypothetical protein
MQLEAMIAKPAGKIVYDLRGTVVEVPQGKKISTP